MTVLLPDSFSLKSYPENFGKGKTEPERDLFGYWLPTMLCFACFVQIFSEIVNLDLDKRAIKLSKKNCESNGINAHFVVADAQALPFQISSFGVVTSFSVVEHLGNQNSFLHDVNRILREEGFS